MEGASSSTGDSNRKGSESVDVVLEDCGQDQISSDIDDDIDNDNDDDIIDNDNDDDDINAVNTPTSHALNSLFVSGKWNTVVEPGGNLTYDQIMTHSKSIRRATKKLPSQKLCK